MNSSCINRWRREMKIKIGDWLLETNKDGFALYVEIVFGVQAVEIVITKSAAELKLSAKIAPGEAEARKHGDLPF